ncbi:MAG: penicillin-binding protein 2 [Candidatus Nealsonbacteria bacterium]
MFGRLSFKKIRKFNREIEPQEVMLDRLAQEKEREFELSEKKIEVPLSQKILRGTWFGFLVLILVLFGKTAQLQIFEGAALTELSENNRYVIQLIRAQRGVIYDKDLKQLVFNQPIFDLVVDKTELSEDESKRKEVLQAVAQITNQEYDEVLRIITDSPLKEVVVAQELDYETLLLFEARRYELTGFRVNNNSIREYVTGPVFSHIIGYQRESGQNNGLEEYYNDVLQPKPGEIQVKRDVYGNPIEKKIIMEPASGQSLVLNIDFSLQEKLIESLERIVRNVGSQTAAAVALNPNNGAVLALVSLPGFDNNLFSSGMTQIQWENLNSEAKPLFNRVISGRYLTGSTIKPLIASAVLEEGIINPDKAILDIGFITIPNIYDPEHETRKNDWAVHGWVDMRKALAESCNVYFYTVGGGYEDQVGLGPTRIKQYLEMFGWSNKTGIDLPGEVAGFLPDKEWKKETWSQDWWDGDTYNMSIGQGFLQITPLEVVSAMAAIANNGTLYEPHVVKEIIDSEKNLVSEIEPKVIRQNFIDEENLQIVREGMRQAVTGIGAPHASAVLLNSLPVTSAAKTGTAELGNDTYHNWASAFAPYENPEIVITVVVEKVAGLKAAALPVINETLNWYFSQ